MTCLELARSCLGFRARFSLLFEKLSWLFFSILSGLVGSGEEEFLQA